MFYSKKKAILTTSACLIYPLGWSDSRVKEICHSNKYDMGICELKWAFTLAIVQCVSSFLLSLLALFLATKTDINPNYKQKLDIQIMNKARVQKENMVQIQQLKEGNLNKKN